MQWAVIDENALIQQCLEGDLDAFRMLYERHHQRVFNLCWRVSNDRHAAEDLCQDVFLRAYRHLTTFQSKSSFATWLHRIAMNTALNHCRKHRGRFIELDAAALQAPTDALQSDPEERPDRQVEKKETAQLLWTAVQSLPEKQRTVLILQKYENHSVKEIAAILDESPSSVESRLYRAKKNLAKKLTHLLKK